MSELKEEQPKHLKSLNKIVYEHILDVLDYTLGNRTWTFEILGIGHRTLQRKLNRMKALGYVIPPPIHQSKRGAKHARLSK